MAKKKSHGGKRKGAGRKPSSPEGPTVLVAVTVPSVLLEQLDAIAKRNEWNRSQAVTNAIRAFVLKR
jgi:hypothetical protein